MTVVSSLPGDQPGHCLPNNFKDRDRTFSLLCSKHYAKSFSRSLLKRGKNEMIKRSTPCIVVTQQMLVNFLYPFPHKIHMRIYSCVCMYNLKNQVKENRNAFFFLRASCLETLSSPFSLYLSEHEMFLNKHI